MLIIRRRYFDENQYWLNNQNKEEAQIASVLKRLSIDILL